MSHFTVIVVGEKNLQEVMAPFEESPKNPETSEFCVFVNKSKDEEELKEYNTKTIEIVELHGVKYSRYSDEVRQYEKDVNPNDILSDKVLELPEGSAQYKGPISLVYPTFEEYLSDWCGYQYDEKQGGYGYWKNPNAKWDWYQVGGRWTGFFKGKKNVKGSTGNPGLMTSAAKKGYFDQIRIKDIDFEGIEKEAIESANETYDKIEKILKGRVYPSWKEIREKHGEDINAAREEYRNHEVVKDFDNAKFFIWGDFYEEYAASREEYVEKCRVRAIVPFAFIKDGEWVEKGQMGWFGMASNEKEQGDWNKEFYEMIKSLPEDTLLTVVDCHI